MRRWQTVKEDNLSRSRCVPVNPSYSAVETYLLQGFLKHLLQYESRLFTLSSSMMEMQQILGLGIGSQENRMVRRHPNVGSQGWARLCGLVCAYRLADVVALLGGCERNKSQVLSMPLPDRDLYVGLVLFSLLLHTKVQILTGHVQA